MKAKGVNVMFCSECGQEISKTAKFCRHCGAKVEVEETKENPAPTPVEQTNPAVVTQTVVVSPKKGSAVSKVFFFVGLAAILFFAYLLYEEEKACGDMGLFKNSCMDLYYAARGDSILNDPYIFLIVGAIAWVISLITKAKK